MSSLPYAGRFLVPLLRTQTLSSTSNVKRILASPCWIWGTPAAATTMAGNCTFPSFLPPPHLPKASGTISSSLQQHSLLTSGFNCMTRTAQTAKPCLLTRGFTQIRHLNLPRSSTNEWAELRRLSIFQRLKVIFKKYWYVALPLHFAGSVAWLGSLYLLCKLGIDGAKFIAWIQPYVIESSLVPEMVKGLFKKDPDTLGSLAVALVLYQLVTPVRDMTTIFGTIYMVKYLLRRGVMVKSASEISKTAKAGYMSHAIPKDLAKRPLKNSYGWSKP